MRCQLFKQGAGPEPIASERVWMYLYYASWSSPHQLAHAVYGSHYTRKQYMTVQTCMTWMFKRGVALKRGEGNRVQYVLKGEE